MSAPEGLGQKAARGAIWTILSSFGGRIVGLAGTLVITRFLHPADLGEVADATILAMLASWASIWGFGQYAVVHGRGDDAAEATWHATVGYLVAGALALGAMALFGGAILPWLGAPAAAAYLPFMALAMFIRRLGAVPERVLTRRFDFRAPGLALGLGEISYTIAAIALAAAGFGGWAIVYANLVQAVVMATLLITAAGRAAWTPTPLRLSRLRHMLKFGVPLGVQNLANQASRYVDKPVVSYYFGTSALGTYNLAYNLADVPAVQVGEQIALVLMPSMASLPPERRLGALERAAALLSLVVFPLAVGIGLVAEPLIALALPAGPWQQVAPLLATLAALSVFRPITWVLSAYYEAESKTHRLMALELAKLVLLVGGIAATHRFGIYAATASVGIAFALAAVGGVLTVVQDGASLRRLATGFAQPLAACAVMAIVALGVQQLAILVGIDAAAAHLGLMIVSGAVAYVGAAFVLAPAPARELLTLARGVLHRRGARTRVSYA